ncbi:MAG: DUF998 domain-containing protein [Candidatus Bathyarchaeota archaeon]|nr:DUF998 domain-containing protein [Candidatus Bathyarchaeota archaeon]
MKYSYERIAGTLLFVAASQFVLVLVVAEALYPGYSISANYISDLGVGPSAIYFNSSVFFMGLLLIIGTYFLQRAFNYKILTVLLVLTAVGAMGVGVFTEDFGTIHTVVSLIAFLFGGLSAIFSAVCSYVHDFKLLKMPFSIIAVILGLISLAALVLLGSNIDLGLGVGGIERMIAYPLLMWGAGFGGYLIASPEMKTVK